MWAEALQRVSEGVPVDASEGVREEINILAARGRPQSGTQFQCGTEFLARRTVQGLHRIKEHAFHEGLQGLEKIKELAMGVSESDSDAPALCLISPAVVDLGASLSTWDTMTIHGFDLDRPDQEGNLIGFSLVNSDGAMVQLIPADVIDRRGHNQILLNLEKLAVTLHRQQITKIVPIWKGVLEGPISGEVMVKAWRPGRDKMVVGPEKTTFVPPHVNGDLDFHTGPRNSMIGFVSAEIEVEARRVDANIRMNAVEKNGDRTRAQGKSKVVLWDKLPANWKILRVLPEKSSKKPYVIRKKGVHVFNQPPGQVVSRFNVYGDQGGDDVGEYTRVEVDWSPITIEIEETGPSWYHQKKEMPSMP